MILPAALPGYVAGLKQGWAFSWRSLMAAEIIADRRHDRLRPRLDAAAVAASSPTIASVLATMHRDPRRSASLIELVFFAPLERRMLKRRGLLVQGGAR